MGPTFGSPTIAIDKLINMNDSTKLRLLKAKTKRVASCDATRIAIFAKEL
jgi:hypothetical protein